MKNSKEYGQKVIKLFNALKRKGSAAAVKYDDPVEALIYATVSENLRESAAKRVLKKIREHFVDINDLRVSRIEEVMEILSKDGFSEESATALKEALNAVFYKYNGMSLLSLTEIGKRQAKKDLGKLEGVSRFVVNYCVLTTLGGHAIPLTDCMIEYLRDSELVYPGADVDDIEGFLERKITLAKAYEFYRLLRHKSESVKKKLPRKAAPEADEKADAGDSKKETKKKAAKKTTSDKKTATKKKTKKTTKKKTVTKKKKATKKTATKKKKTKKAKKTKKKKTTKRTKG
ncbi:MAG: hypothetical protein KAT00_00470 [Planctomycetes bacterium]|nr:hypothetical protein [Planctomycetota bacterium]